MEGLNSLMVPFRPHINRYRVFVKHYGVATGTRVSLSFRPSFRTQTVSHPCFSSSQFTLPSQIRGYYQRGGNHSYPNSYSQAQPRLLEKLEAEANARPKDAYSQLRLLAELNKAHPQIVLQRVESGYFANSEGVYKEYLKALVATNKIDQYPFQEISSRLGIEASMQEMPAPDTASQNLGWPTPAFASMQNINKDTSTEAPVKVQLVASGTQQLWGAFRMLAFVYFLFYFLGSVPEGLSVSKQFGFNNEVHPQRETAKTFEDVKGASEAKEELMEIINYLKNPSKFTRLGGKLPKGVLLTGPPGTGKTLLAKAVAGEAGVPFFYASGSEFEEMYVGVGAKRVRELFASAKRHAPCIVFIDEIDAIGSTRALKEQQAMKMTLNQLLVELDGFEDSEGVIIIGATNLPEILDPALIRPGRFDRNVVVPLPDLREREEILDLYLQKVPHAKNVDKLVLARGCPGLSGAELANLVNIAALRASTQDKDFVNMYDLEFAKDKILMGGERKNAIIPDEVKKLTAWHESGHALVAYFTAGALPLHKATVMPRGLALGMVVQLPEESDLLQRTKKQMLAAIDVCMGGRVAEEIVFGQDNITSGASSDIEKATHIAKLMVRQYGMSSKVGVVYLGEKQSSKMAEEEVKKILTDSYERVKKLLKRRRTELDRLATNLLEYETLTGEDISTIMAGHQLPALQQARATAENSSQPARWYKKQSSPQQAVPKMIFARPNPSDSDKHS